MNECMIEGLKNSINEQMNRCSIIDLICNQMKIANAFNKRSIFELAEIMSTLNDERVPAGHALSKNSVPKSKSGTLFKASSWACMNMIARRYHGIILTLNDGSFSI